MNDSKLDIPNFFSDKSKLMSFDYSKIKELCDSEIDHAFPIDYLTPIVNKEILLEGYFKSILLGYNHVFISKILSDLENPSANPIPKMRKGYVSVILRKLRYLSHC